MSIPRSQTLNSLIKHLITGPMPVVDDVMVDLLDGLDSVIQADACAILRLHPGSGTARLLAGKNLRSPRGAGTVSIEVPRITALLSGCGSGQARTDNGPFHDDPFLDGEGAGSLLLACMDFGMERLVTVALRHREEKFSAPEKERFLIISGVINLMIGCSYDVHEHAQHRDLDPLTGLGLYPAFHDTLDKEISRSRRRSGKITVGILKVVGKGDLKEIEAAPEDSTILLVADTLVKQLRNFDTVIRYSGAEFALILPDIGGEDAEKVMDRVVDAVRSSNGKKAVRLYAGLSCYPEDGSTAERLIETAEAALNKAVEELSMDVMRWREK